MNLQLVLTVQTYSQRFAFVARCFPLKSKGGFKLLSLSVLSDYFAYKQVIYMIPTFTNYNFILRFSRQMFLQVEYLHSSCSWRQKELKETNMAFSFKSRKTRFLATEKKASFGLEKLIICFPVRFCVRVKLRAEVQTFWKTQDFVTFFAGKCKQVQQLGGFYSEIALSI